MNKNTATKKQVYSQIKQLFNQIIPSNADFSKAFMMTVVPVLILCVGRLWLFNKSASNDWLNLWRIMPGELYLWFLMATIVAFLTHFFHRYRWGFYFLFMMISIVYAILTIVDLGMFAMTGSRIDLENLEVFAEEISLIWPVVSSEMTWVHWGGFAVVVVSNLFTFLIRPLVQGSRWKWRVIFLSLFPIMIASYAHVRRPVKELKPLDKNLMTLFVQEMIQRQQAHIIPPTNDDLTALTVSYQELDQINNQQHTQSPNLVLIILESTGLHQTSLTQPQVNPTPNLAALAAQGLYSKNMTTVLPHTTKALLSILCGDWPHLERRAKEALPGGLPNRCLPHLMKDLGYRTAFMQTARETFEERKELVKAMGFDVFRARETLDYLHFEDSNYFGLDDLALVNPSLHWAESDTQTPFFMTYLTLTSHHKYTLPQHATTADHHTRSRKEQHLATVKYVDHVVGKLIQAYKDKNLYQNTIFMFVGDHGEAMGEHGRWQHDQVIWDEGLKVPFVIHAPHLINQKGELKGLHQQIDILPTVIDLVRARIQTGKTRGMSVLSEIPSDRVLYHSCLKQRSCLARRQGNFKFIDHDQHRKWELFDLSKDPTEQSNIAHTVEGKILQHYQAELKEWRARVMGHYKARAQQLMNPELRSPTVQQAQATWNQAMSLLGCTTQRKRLIPQDTLWLHCDWRVEKQIEAWKNQIRVVDAEGQSFIADWKPFHGIFPTFRWKIHTKVSDEVPMTLPSTIAIGTAQVFIGWQSYSGVPYKQQNGKIWHSIGDIKIEKAIKDGGTW